MARRTHRARRSLEAGYRRMARDREREAIALKWAEALVGDVAEEPRRRVTPSRAAPSGRR
jgi:hypothetical protein